MKIWQAFLGALLVWGGALSLVQASVYSPEPAPAVFSLLAEAFQSDTMPSQAIEIDLKNLKPAFLLEREILQSMDGGMDLGLKAPPLPQGDEFQWVGFVATNTNDEAAHKMMYEANHPENHLENQLTDSFGKERQVLCIAENQHRELSFGWSGWPTDADELALQACGDSCLSLGCMIR